MPIANSGKQKRQRTGHPHEDAGRRLVVQRGQAAEPRHLGIVRDRATRSANVSRADRTVFCTSARSRYGISSQGDQRGRLGYGRTTGYQNNSAAPRKQTCCR